MEAPRGQSIIKPQSHYGKVGATDRLISPRHKLAGGMMLSRPVPTSSSILHCRLANPRLRGIPLRRNPASRRLHRHDRHAVLAGARGRLRYRQRYHPFLFGSNFEARPRPRRGAVCPLRNAVGRNAILGDPTSSPLASPMRSTRSLTWHGHGTVVADSIILPRDPHLVLERRAPSADSYDDASTANG